MVEKFGVCLCDDRNILGILEIAKGGYGIVSIREALVKGGVARFTSPAYSCRTVFPLPTCRTNGNVRNLSNTCDPLTTVYSGRTDLMSSSLPSAFRPLVVGLTQSSAGGQDWQVLLEKRGYAGSHTG